MDNSGPIKQGLPSRHVTEGYERASHRAMLYSMGLTKQEIHQPFVGVVSCWNEAAPCNISLMRQAQAAKRGVTRGGGTPREFATISVTVCTYRDGVDNVRLATPLRERCIAPASVPPNGNSSS